MPMHDWTSVEAGIFHDFHTVWIGETRTLLNQGLLPAGYYALAEQHAGEMIADILTLQPLPDLQPGNSSFVPRESGGVAVIDAPPRVRMRQTITHDLRRTLAIRHVSGHRLVALLEIISPSNKDRLRHVEEFAGKVCDALNAGVHVLLVDPFRPGPHDPQGMHGVLCDLLDGGSAKPLAAPPAEPLIFSSYAADRAQTDAYLETLAIGGTLPEMPLFLSPDRYVNVPLEQTYLSAWRGMPAFWREVLEGKRAQ